MPIPVALDEELLAFCSRELGRARPLYASGSSVDTENLKCYQCNKVIYSYITYICLYEGHKTHGRNYWTYKFEIHLVSKSGSVGKHKEVSRKRKTTGFSILVLKMHPNKAAGYDLYKKNKRFLYLIFI